MSFGLEGEAVGTKVERGVYILLHTCGYRPEPGGFRLPVFWSEYQWVQVI